MPVIMSLPLPVLMVFALTTPLPSPALEMPVMVSLPSPVSIYPYSSK